MEENALVAASIHINDTIQQIRPNGLHSPSSSQVGFLYRVRGMLQTFSHYYRSGWNRFLWFLSHRRLWNRFGIGKALSSWISLSPHVCGWVSTAFSQSAVVDLGRHAKRFPHGQAREKFSLQCRLSSSRLTCFSFCQSLKGCHLLCRQASWGEGTIPKWARIREWGVFIFIKKFPRSVPERQSALVAKKILEILVNTGLGAKPKPALEASPFCVGRDTIVLCPFEECWFLGNLCQIRYISLWLSDSLKSDMPKPNWSLRHRISAEGFSLDRFPPTSYSQLQPLPYNHASQTANLLVGSVEKNSETGSSKYLLFYLTHVVGWWERPTFFDAHTENNPLPNLTLLKCIQPKWDETFCK